MRFFNVNGLPNWVYIPESWGGLNESNPFVIKIKLNAANTEVKLGGRSDLKYNCNIDWGDGNEPVWVVSNIDDNLRHIYTAPGEYMIKINRIISGLGFI